MKMHSFIPLLLPFLWISPGMMAQESASKKVAEYWFDDNVSKSTTFDCHGDSISKKIPYGELESGLHVLYVRAYTDSKRGAIFQYPFFTSNHTLSAGALEYWFDDKYDNRIIRQVESGSSVLNVPFDEVSSGLHILSVRTYEKNGGRGTIFQYPFFTSDYVNEAGAYEYWFDDEYSSRVVSHEISGKASFKLSLDNVPKGIHVLNVRAFNRAGGRGTIYQHVFTKADLTSLAGYEYWVDEDVDETVRVTSNVTLNKISVDFSGYADGMHVIHVRAFDSDGLYGADMQYPFIVGGKGSDGIDAYRFITDREERCVALEQVNYATTQKYSVPMPQGKLPEFRELVRAMSFKGDTVSCNIEILAEVIFQLRAAVSKRWIQPLHEEIGFNIPSVKATSLPLFQYTAVSKPEEARFNAFKFSAEQSADYWLRGSQSATVAVMRGDGEGEPVIITPEEFVAGRQLSFTPGDYYGIIVDAPVNDRWPDSEISLRLSDSADDVTPAPEIKFEGGRVSMTCANPNAEIRYTVDYDMTGKTPTAEDALYTDPFTLERNAVIMARAYAEGFEESPTTRFVIDSFVTPKPRIDQQGLRIVIATDNDTDAIYYTLDGTDPRDFSRATRYAGPFDLPARSVSVKACALREGYSVSGVESLDFKVEQFTVDIPSITRTATGVRMECSTPDAEIRYTTDGSDPSANSTLYTAEIPYTGNMTYTARGFKSGMFPSPAVTLKVADLAAPAPTFSLDAETLKLTISCSDSNAEILYAIGSEDVAANGQVYDKANGLTLEAKDQVVYAIARRAGYNDSEVASYQFVLSANQVAKPDVHVNKAGTHVVMTCATDGAKIRYNVSTDGKAPTAPASASEGIAYTGEIQLQGNAIYAARAFAEGKYRSEATTLDVNNQALSVPHAEYRAHAVWLTSEDREAAIMYSVDSDACDRVYDAATGVPVEESCTVTFIAVREHFNDSPKGSFEFRIDDYKVEAPTFTPYYEGAEITITASDNSTLTVELTVESGGETRVLTQQSEGETLTISEIREGQNANGYVVRSISAIAKPGNPDLYQSDAESFVAEYYAAPALNHHGATLDIESETGLVNVTGFESGAEVAIDRGLTETGYISNQELGCLYTITLRTAGPSAFPSEEVAYDNDAFFDFRAALHAIPTAGIRNSGHLAEAFADEVPESEIALTGPFADNDFALLAEVGREIEYLDMTDVTASRLPDGVFTPLHLLSSVILPATLSEGSHPFGENPRLTSLVWSGKEVMPEGIAGSVGNPNLLVYADNAMLLPDDAPQRVTRENGAWEAKSLRLTRGHAFGVLYPFQAAEASLTMAFTQSTPIGGCEGWETLALPFEVESITHETNGPIVPFALFAGDPEGPRPFWLYEASGDDTEGSMWRSASRIKAGRPYLISMPNHEIYDADWNLKGNVTFAASEVMMTPENSEAREEKLKNHSFVSLFLPFDEESDDLSGVLGLNAGRTDLYGDKGVLASGSAFHTEVVPQPLSGYVRSDLSVRYLPVWGEESGAGALLNPDALVIEPVSGGVLITSGSDRKVRIYTTTGLLLRTVELRGGVTERVVLSPEVYFIEGRKVLTH